MFELKPKVIPPPLQVPDALIFVLSLGALVTLVLDFGYPRDYWIHLCTDIYYIFYGFFLSAFFVQTIFPRKSKQQPRGFFVILTLALCSWLASIVNLTIYLLFEVTDLNTYVAGSVFLLSIFDFSARLYRLNRQALHPALVFVLSFVVLIAIGTLLLLTPRATVAEISFIDALFTSTSAVCVTGLVVMDTGKEFTLTGQCIILGLIQTGALGMLSFASLFALFFKGAGSYDSQLTLKDMINARTLDGTMKVLRQIIVFVLIAEIIGAVGIYLITYSSFDSIGNQIFFSAFHSISAFCNAGFSTLPDSLFTTGYRDAYLLHLVIAGLVITGGLGYQVAINLYQYLYDAIRFQLKRRRNTLKRGRKQQQAAVKPHFGLNERIVLFTTLSLLIFGMVFFYLLEREHTLRAYDAAGAVVTSLFGSVTTRTAGFNTVDTGTLRCRRC